MALSITLNDIIMVRLNYKLAGDTAYNVLHYRLQAIPVTTTPFLPALAEIAETMYTAWSDVWSPGASELVTMDGVTVQSLTGDKSIPVTYRPTVPTPGGLDGEPLPLQDSWTALKRGRMASRHGLGRAFFVGLTETVQVGGVITDNGQKVLLTAFASKLKDNVTVSVPEGNIVCDPVITSGPQAKVGLGVGVELGLPGDWVIKSQRRRRPGKGI